MRSTTEHAYVDQVSAVRQHGDRIRTTAEEKVAEQMEVDTTAAGDLIDKAEAELDVRLGEARARTETLVGRFIPLVHGSRIRRLSRLQDQARVWRQQSDALIRHGDTISLSALCDLLLAIDPKDPEVESRARVLVALRASVFEQLGDAATGLTERLIELRTTAVAALRAHWEDVQTKFEQDLKPALDELRPAHEHLCDELRKAGREPLPPLPAT